MPQAPTPLHQKKAWQACVLRIQAGAELQAAEAGTKVPTAAAVSRKIFSAMPPPVLKSKEQDPEGKHDPETAFERSWKLYLTGERVPALTRQQEIIDAALVCGFIRTPGATGPADVMGLTLWKVVAEDESQRERANEITEFREAERRAEVLLADLAALVRPVATAAGVSNTPAAALVSYENRRAIRKALADLMGAWEPGQRDRR